VVAGEISALGAREAQIKPQTNPAQPLGHGGGIRAAAGIDHCVVAELRGVRRTAKPFAPLAITVGDQLLGTINKSAATDFATLCQVIQQPQRATAELAPILALEHQLASTSPASFPVLRLAVAARCGPDDLGSAISMR
jgi:hypothetical protein